MHNVAKKCLWALDIVLASEEWVVLLKWWNNERHPEGGTNIHHNGNLRRARCKFNIVISKLAGVTAGIAKQTVPIEHDRAMETTCNHKLMAHGGDQLCESEVSAKQAKKNNKKKKNSTKIKIKGSPGTEVTINWNQNRPFLLKQY